MSGTSDRYTAVWWDRPVPPILAVIFNILNVPVVISGPPPDTAPTVGGRCNGNICNRGRYLLPYIVDYQCDHRDCWFNELFVNPERTFSLLQAPLFRWFLTVPNLDSCSLSVPSQLFDILGTVEYGQSCFSANCPPWLCPLDIAQDS